MNILLNLVLLYNTFTNEFKKNMFDKIKCKFDFLDIEIHLSQTQLVFKKIVAV